MRINKFMLELQNKQVSAILLQLDERTAQKHFPCPRLDMHCSIKNLMNELIKMYKVEDLSVSTGAQSK